MKQAAKCGNKQKQKETNSEIERLGLALEKKQNEEISVGFFKFENLQRTC